MRLFLYYALHTFKNTLKKIFKTWVLIFIVVCMLIGGGIGLFAASLSDAAEERAAQNVESTDLTEPSDTEDSSAREESEDEIPIEDLMDPENLIDQEALKQHKADLIEFFGGIIVLIIFIYEAMSADKNGSKIFQPADVNILFASPMRPQSVLLFRVLTQLGMALILSLYLLFQLPNLILNLGLSVPAAFGVILAWGLAVGAGKMIQVLLYTICSTRPELKKRISQGVYAILALLAVGFIVSTRLNPPASMGNGLLDKITYYYDTFRSYLNAPFTRFIPLWGWIKGFLYYATSDNIPMAAIFFVLTAGGCVLLVYIIYHVKADFYEDAMAKSEETAALLQRAETQAQGGIAFVRRKKDRSEKIRRDGMNHGRGASVFFFKTIYNRFRFAHLGLFTKTTETYFAAAVLVALLCRFVIHTDSIIPAALTLAGLSFFRSLGNPLEQDTRMSYFNMVPSKTYAKLFFSLMGGTVNCFLDLLLGLLAATLILQAPVVDSLGWALVIVSVDMYATIVGCFIDVSVPISAGKTLKQVVQIMFIYFGLLPDIIVVAMALVLSTPLTAILGVLAVNLIFSTVFFILTTVAIDMCFGK